MQQQKLNIIFVERSKIVNSDEIYFFRSFFFRTKQIMLRRISVEWKVVQNIQN